MKICVYADIHGYFGKPTAEIARGCDYIVVAGDIGDPEILAQLRKMGMVIAVRGNHDKGLVLPKMVVFQMDDVCLYVQHAIESPYDQSISGVNAEEAIETIEPTIVVYGHTHQRKAVVRDGTLFVNPGTTGEDHYEVREGDKVKSFKTKRTCAILDVEKTQVTVQFIDVDNGGQGFEIKVFPMEL